MDLVTQSSSSCKVDAIVVFVDIRGFTAWSENTEVFQYSPGFINDFYSNLTHSFSDWYFKALGDGALLVKEIGILDTKGINKAIKEVLSKVVKIGNSFTKQCDAFAKIRGQETNLELGWGITRGAVNKIVRETAVGTQNDYIGANINKAARLCDLARPKGIVIDAQDFSKKPQIPSLEFFEQKRLVKSLQNPVRIWVTEAISSQFLTREELKETPEVHVAGFCYRLSNGAQEILLAKRKKSRRLYPGLLEGCGGQLRYNESFKQGVVRHYRTEMNMVVNVHDHIYQLYDISIADNPYIPGVVFLCKYVEGEPKSNNHDSLKWLSMQEVLSLPEDAFIPGIKSELLHLMDLLQEKGEHA